MCTLCTVYTNRLSIAGVNRKLLEAFSLLSSPNVSSPFFLPETFIMYICHSVQEVEELCYNSELVCLLLALLDTATASGKYCPHQTGCSTWCS